LEDSLKAGLPADRKLDLGGKTSAMVLHGPPRVLLSWVGHCLLCGESKWWHIEVKEVTLNEVRDSWMKKLKAVVLHGLEILEKCQVAIMIWTIWSFQGIQKILLTVQMLALEHNTSNWL